MTIGEKIHYIRTSQLISREELSEKSGIGKTSIYNYETDKRDMTIDILEKITQALNVPISIIFNTLSCNDITFKDTIDLYLAQIDRETPEQLEEIECDGNIYCVGKKWTEEEFSHMYRLHFAKLLEWKLSKLETDYDFFNLIISWYAAINPKLDMDSSDIDELSVLFTRMLSFKYTENKLMSMLVNFESSDTVESMLRMVNDVKLKSDIKFGRTNTIWDILKDQNL